MHSIEATRKGFLYQDKAALFKYLDYFFDPNKIFSFNFFLDYNDGLENQQSIDFFLQVNGNKNFYEVKTGENFLKNCKKNGISEIHKTINIFIDIEKKHPGSSNHLLIPRNPTGDLGKFVHHIQIIKEGKSSTDGEKETAISWLSEATKKKIDPHSLKDYCKNIKIEHCDPDYAAKKTHYSEIDNTIISRLDGILEKFTVGPCIEMVKTFFLYFQLLHICQKNAGSNKDISPLLISNIQDFIVQRNILKDFGSNDYNLLSKKNQYFQDIQTKWKEENLFQSNQKPQIKYFLKNISEVIHE